MGAPLSSRLQAAVQSVQWTYSLFWQPCPQQGVLVWGDGYYNGAIKTRKTVQSMEVSAEEAYLQRSQQLRELYGSLSARETNPPTRRPCAALSPEDLSESEWFYLMCVSFSFPPGVGLPGKAYARRQHVWLAGTNEVDSKTFCRAILAKSARVQTVVCIPLLDGVVELGTTDKVQEDLNFIQHVKSFFVDHHPPPPKPVLSEHSTSNPTSSSAAVYAVADPPAASPASNYDMDEDDEEADSEAETARPDASGVAAAEPSELMQLKMSEDIRVGSPDDSSNNLDADLHLLAVSQTGDQERRAESYRAESSRKWDGSGLQLPASVGSPLEDLTYEDAHYSQTVSTILQNHSIRCPQSSSISYITYLSESAFANWNSHAHHLHVSVDSTSKPRDACDPITRFRGKDTPQDKLGSNHALAERRRREKLNEKFIILRSLVPFVTKMDQASILGDTIEYVKQLRKKIQDLEARNRQMEANQQSKEQQRRGATVCSDKRKVRIVEGSGGMTKAKTVERSALASPSGVVTPVQVSIIESDALLELECADREGLLLDVMQMLRGMRIEVRTVQSSRDNGVIAVELRAKMKENANGKKASIVEVKRALDQIIPHTD